LAFDCLPADGSFTLLIAGSPCENNGTPTAAPAWDFEGDVRPQSFAPDIGPDERTP
jgi:hypothetical protein